MTIVPAPRRSLACGKWLTLAAMACAAPEIANGGPGIEAEPTDEIGRVTTPPDPKGSNHFTLGAGVAATPHFQGSDGYQGEPVPLVDAQFGRFFARSGEGIGLDAIETQTFRAGLAVNWMQGYDDDDAPRGLDEVKDALGARLFASVRFKGTVTTVAATKAITESERGLLLNASLARPVPLTSRLTIVPSIGTTWADEDYMVSYFGVDPAEAAVSGFSPYRPGSGFKDASFRLAASYRITNKTSIVAFAGVTHLLGDAADSPFIERKTQPLGLVGLTYSFK